MDSPIQYIFAILSVELFRFLFAPKGAESSSKDKSEIELCKTLCSVCRLWRDRFIHEYSSEIPKWKRVMDDLRCEEEERNRSRHCRSYGGSFDGCFFHGFSNHSYYGYYG